MIYYSSVFSIHEKGEKTVKLDMSDLKNGNKPTNFMLTIHKTEELEDESVKDLYNNSDYVMSKTLYRMPVNFPAIDFFFRSENGKYFFIKVSLENYKSEKGEQNLWVKEITYPYQTLFPKEEENVSLWNVLSKICDIKYTKQDVAKNGLPENVFFVYISPNNFQKRNRKQKYDQLNVILVGNTLLKAVNGFLHVRFRKLIKESKSSPTSKRRKQKEK